MYNEIFLTFSNVQNYFLSKFKNKIKHKILRKNKNGPQPCGVEVPMSGHRKIHKKKKILLREVYAT